MRIYSVYDVKAAAFTTPIFSRNNATAIRSFTLAVEQEENEFNKHAEDYSLFALGEWDELNGKIAGSTPIQIVTALELLDQEGPMLVPRGGE